MVAECLGALAAICPVQVAETIDALLSHQSSSKMSETAMDIAEDEEEKKLTAKSEARVRWTACASLKHAASLQPTRMSAETAEVLRPRVKASLALLEDPDLNVKRQAAVMLNACVHHQLALVPRGPCGDLIESGVVTCRSAGQFELFLTAVSEGDEHDAPTPSWALRRNGRWNKEVQSTLLTQVTRRRGHAR
jgi:hypothetical protein